MKRRAFLGALAAAWVPATRARTLFLPAWAAYRQRFVRASGAVIDSHQGIAHSESQGVTMLLATHADDRDAFEAVWRFTRTELRRDDRLFAWSWSKGRVQDANNATDGDLYIAWALLRAARRFAQPALLHEALAIAAAIDRHLVTEGTHGVVLRPALQGFDAPGRPSVINPSYFVLPALRELGHVHPSTRFWRVADNVLAILSYARFGTAQLPPDWLELSDPVRPYTPKSRRFSFDAVRIPLFLAWDGQFVHPALAAFVRWAQRDPLPAWVDLLDDQPAPFAAPAGVQAVAALARAAHLNTAVRIPAQDSDYYSASLCLLSLMAAHELGLRGA